MTFEDHFSGWAREYARYRPSYPAELFAHLASLAPDRRLAWDCGAGNGQAALALAAHFERVVATDASPEQVTHAVSHPKVEYRVEPAESVSLDRESVDLITVAAAVHWFDLDRFFAEARRVLKRDGLLAVWTYFQPRIDPSIDRILEEFHARVLAGFWPERFHYVEECYRTLPFPFTEWKPPEFIMEAEWDLEQLVGFVDSWSASGKYEKERGRRPVLEITAKLNAAWGSPGKARTILWPLYLRVGRKG